LEASAPAGEVEAEIKAELEVDELDGVELAAIERLAKRRRTNDSFPVKSIDLDQSTSSDLNLLLWAVSNGISRDALNDVFFDAFLESVGKDPPENRHMMDQYLHVLDDLVRASIGEALKSIPSVSVSSNGWRDSARRYWVNLVVEFIREKTVPANAPKQWELVAFEPDIIILPSSVSSGISACLVNDALKYIVRRFLCPFSFSFLLTRGIL